MKTNLLLIISLLSFLSAYAQDPFPDYAPIYKDDVVARVDITIPPDSLTVILSPGNEESEYYFHATFMFDNGTIRDTFENAGFQLRGNTSRYAKKKSFQISLNTYVPGRKWYGIEKINLNGEHNDPTVSRSKIAWDLLRDIGVPGPRASHVELYINNTYFGLYANVEHIDEEFVQTRFGNNDGNLYKCLWPADLKYLGGDPDLYKFESGDRRVYELITNEETDDYTDLAHFIEVLNNTPIDELRCELDKIFNINSYLLAMAFDILSGNWDGPLYNKNNFYLYHNEATGKFEYMPYDLDNTFGIDWFDIDWAERNIYAWGHSTQPRPLYWRVLEEPEYRNRFSFYLNRIINTQYKEGILFAKIDSLRTLLLPSVDNDFYYTLDYDFDIEDFTKGFSQTLPYNHTPIGIKPFIAERRSATINQLVLNDISPIINNVKHNRPSVDEEIVIRAFVEDDHGVDHVEVNIELTGVGMIISEMFDDGQHGDAIAGDNIFGTIIPSIPHCDSLKYSIIATDDDGKESRDPVCHAHLLVICNSTLTLAINEFMASNETTIADESGEYEDWVEIYNYGTETITLGDLYLSDKKDNPVKWQFPDISIDAGEYLLVWLDEDGSQGPLHANFKLSADGEYIGIYDNDASGNALIDDLDFTQQQMDVSFGRLPNGTGNFQSLYPTPGSTNQLGLATPNQGELINYNIYPNPTSDLIYVDIDLLPTEEFQIVLLNIYGQEILKQVGINRAILDISLFPGGIYLIGIKSASGFSVLEEVVKQ
ncbi:MAG TPA: CotH kinase family protein [Saprospiraceae bacterium]|nr:CotH kinase family protein [Saprospiraceae bacterium]